MFFVLPVEENRTHRRFPLVNFLLIGLNLYVFLKTATLVSFEAYVRKHGFTPAHPHLGDVLTSMFLHAGLLHLLGNMYFLYVFGDKVEERIGRIPFAFAYLASGFGAAYSQYNLDPHSTIPMIGASGAISGICALYMAMFPWERMRWQFFFLIFPIFSIPSRAVFVVGLWFVEQYLMASFAPSALGGVAFGAHVGGFLTGLALWPFLYQKKPSK